MLSSSKSSFTSLFLLFFPSHALRAYLSGHNKGEGGQGWRRLSVHQGGAVPSLPDQSGELSRAGPGMVTEVSHSPAIPRHCYRHWAWLARQSLGQDRRSPGWCLAQWGPGRGQSWQQPGWQQLSKEASPRLGPLPPSPRGWPTGCACCRRTAFLWYKVL